MAEAFQVTARKWRPMTFADVVGQDHVTRTLKNAIREGRLAHAYLFTGQRGCGKTTVARLLAKAINCPNAAANDYEPCNACDVCQSVTEGRSMDVSEIDGASNNGVDDVRSLRDNVKYPPLQGKYKVIIIDEVHMLSTSAFNALLKTLEEPPRHLVFIFATTEVQKVLPTILSRTQRYDFRRMQLEEITGRLRTIADKDGISIDDDALLVIAKKADGSMRDAQSIFDQIVAYCGTSVETVRVQEALNLIDTDFFFGVTDAIVERTPAKAFELAHAIVSRGYDVEEFFLGLLEHFRNFLTHLVTRSTRFIEVSKVHQERYANGASDFTEGDLIRLLRLGQSALERLKTSQQPRIVLETSLVEMVMMERAVEFASLLGELRSLRSGGLAPVQRAQATATATTAAIAPPVARAPRQVVTERALDRLPTERAAERAMPPPTEAPVRDSPEISEAGPQPRPESSYSLEKVEASARQPAAKPTKPEKKQAGSGLELDSAEIKSRWAGFAEYVRGQKSRYLRSVIDSILFCGARRNIIFLGADDKALRDQIAALKDDLQLYLRSYFGYSGIQFELGEPEAMAVKSGEPLVRDPEVVREALQGQAERSPSGSRAANSPMEEALIKQLGAQPMD